MRRIHLVVALSVILSASLVWSMKPSSQAAAQPAAPSEGASVCASSVGVESHRQPGNPTKKTPVSVPSSTLSELSDVCADSPCADMCFNPDGESELCTPHSPTVVEDLFIFSCKRPDGSVLLCPEETTVHKITSACWCSHCNNGQGAYCIGCLSAPGAHTVHYECQ